MAEYKGGASEGQRQAMLEKQRAKMLNDFEKQREKITKDNQVNITSNKFVTQFDDVEDSLKKETIGLVKLEDFQKIRKEILIQKEREAARTAEISVDNFENPNYSNNSTKSEDNNTTSDYNNEGDSISAFLEKCRQQFHELRGVSVDNLLYVKEDLIIPHHYTFYDFIVNKARGKSGPLFNFDVHDDVRLTHDATVEKDESHAGKVVERNWYEKNKHIFPASRWEIYDPEKN
ncbi:6666_t:CDS:2, partial [Entrophospora sp. SA101]